MNLVGRQNDGLLPPLLILMTVATGVVDAISYLKLQHVFVANMTGNVVFLGFALSDAKEFSITASLTAIAAFMAGALCGGRFLSGIGGHRPRLLAVTALIEAIVVATALGLTILVPDLGIDLYFLIVLLAFAMGLQNATSRRLGVPDLTTSVLTLTITGLAADPKTAVGEPPRRVRRLLSVGAMLAGAAIGATLVIQIGITSALALVLLLLAVTCGVAFRLPRA